MFRNTSLFIKNFLVCFYLKPNIWMEYAKARPHIWVFFTCRQNTDHLETIAVSLFTLGLRFSYFKFNKHLFTQAFCLFFFFFNLFNREMNESHHEGTGRLAKVTGNSTQSSKCSVKMLDLDPVAASWRDPQQTNQRPSPLINWMFQLECWKLQSVNAMKLSPKLSCFLCRVGGTL